MGTRHLFCGITLHWDYVNRTVRMSLPNYVNKALEKLHHVKPKKPQHSPHYFTPPKFGAKTQMVAATKAIPPLNKIENKYVQRVVGIF